MPVGDGVELSDLILEIYDTALDAGRWPTVLDRVAHFIGARGAFLFELRGSGVERRIAAPYFSSSYDRALVEHYLVTHNDQELADQDVFARHSRQTDRIQLIPDDVLAGSEVELLARGNVSQMLQYGIRYRAGALLNKDQLNHDRFALQFSSRAGPVGKDHIARAALVMPHMAKALNVSRPTTQLAQRFRSVADCIDLLNVGVCILNADGVVVLVNREFERQLDECKVFRRGPSGHLGMVADVPGAHFDRMRDGIAGHGRFGARPRKEAIVTTVDGQTHTLCVEIVPLQSADELGEPRLRGHIIYSMDTGNAYAIDGAMLADMFNLTRTEATILELMAEGLTNAQISERRSKSIETINSQVKSILDKTRSSNRTQAIRLATNISSSFVLEALHQNG